MVARKELTAYLDGLLQPSLFKDSTFNGLQIEGKFNIEKIGFAVDSSLAIFRKAVDTGCEMVVVHHGLIWGGLKKVTGHQKERLALLLKENINLYVSHIPLDKHPTVGNNAGIAKALGAKVTGDIGEAGIIAELKKPVSFDRFLAASRELFGQDIRYHNFCENKIGAIAVCSGAVPLSFMQEAFERDVNTVLTGEGMGESMFLYPARENGMNVVFAGHTATETFGVRALMERINKDFKGKVESFYLQD